MQEILMKLKDLKNNSGAQLQLAPAQINELLFALAAELEGEQQALLLQNKKDCELYLSTTMTMAPEIANPNGRTDDERQSKSAFLDRLTLNPQRIAAMAESLRQVAELPSPCGEITEERTLSNGLKLKKIRSPLGVVMMIFESRPNVIIEAFSLAWKSGNSLILRGGKESRFTSRFLYDMIEKVFKKIGFHQRVFWGIDNPDREWVQFLIKQDRFVDILVPRGGEGLIDFVAENSRIPIIKNDRGLCHIYVDEDADMEMAKRIIKNAKVQRPGVCNSVETLLVHERIAATFLPEIFQELSGTGLNFEPVRWHCCQESLKILSAFAHVEAAIATSFDTEYLDFDINCRVVPSLPEAMEHIKVHGSKHSEVIITKDKLRAKEFQQRVDAAVVYWNASSRFTDGYAMGLGGELGISTQKLHVRGPVGLKEMTSERWLIDGQGQIR